MASYSAFFPRAREVLKVCNENKGQPQQPTRDGQEEIRLYEEARKADLAFYKTITQEQKEASRKEILALNPIKGKVLAGLSLEGPAWRSIILRKLRDGITISEENDVDV